MKKIKFDDCFLTPEESMELNQSGDRPFLFDDLPEDSGFCVEEARKIIIERVKLICEYYGIQKPHLIDN